MFKLSECKGKAKKHSCNSKDKWSDGLRQIVG